MVGEEEAAQQISQSVEFYWTQYIAPTDQALSTTKPGSPSDGPGAGVGAAMRSLPRGRCREGPSDASRKPTPAPGGSPDRKTVPREWHQTHAVCLPDGLSNLWKKEPYPVDKHQTRDQRRTTGWSSTTFCLERRNTARDQCRNMRWWATTMCLRTRLSTSVKARTGGPRSFRTTHHTFPTVQGCNRLPCHYPSLHHL